MKHKPTLCLGSEAHNYQQVINGDSPAFYNDENNDDSEGFALFCSKCGDHFIADPEFEEEQPFNVKSYPQETDPSNTVHPTSPFKPL